MWACFSGDNSAPPKKYCNEYIHTVPLRANLAALFILAYSATKCTPCCPLHFSKCCGIQLRFGSEISLDRISFFYYFEENIDPDSNLGMLDFWQHIYSRING